MHDPRLDLEVIARFQSRERYITGLCFSNRSHDGSLSGMIGIDSL